MKISESKAVKGNTQNQERQKSCCSETINHDLSTSDIELFQIVQDLFPSPQTPPTLTNSILEKIRAKAAQQPL